MNSEKAAKELSRSFKNIAYMMQIGGHAVKIVIATKAIKKYIDVE